MAQLGVSQYLAEAANFPLAGQEYEYVARWLLFCTFVLFDFLHRTQHAIRPTLVPIVLIASERTVTHIYRIGSPADFDDRRATKELAKAFHFDGGGGDDDLQIRPFRQQLPQVAHQKVDVKAAFVGLINNQGIVTVQEPVVLDLRQQDAVGHDFDPRLVGRGVGKTYLIPHLAASLLSKLFSNTTGYGTGRNPAGLGVADQPANTPTAVHADLGDLGGLTGTGFAGNDHHLVLFNGLTDIIDPFRHWQR